MRVSSSVCPKCLQAILSVSYTIFCTFRSHPLTAFTYASSAISTPLVLISSPHSPAFPLWFLHWFLSDAFRFPARFLLPC